MNGTWNFMFAKSFRAPLFSDDDNLINRVDNNLINRSRAKPLATIVINISSSVNVPINWSFACPTSFKFINFKLARSTRRVFALEPPTTTDLISLWPITFYGAHNHFITNWSWTEITVNLLVLRQAHMVGRTLFFAHAHNFDNHCLSRQSALDHRRR